MFNLNYMGVDDFIYFGPGADAVIKPVDFKPKREDVYAGEYTTMNGSIIADSIGWKYSDLTLNWDILPQDMVDILIGINGVTTFAFDAEDGAQSESVIRTSAVSLKNRATMDNKTWWRDVSVTLRFINTHAYNEESS